MRGASDFLASGKDASNKKSISYDRRCKLIQSKLWHLKLIIISKDWPLFIRPFHVGHPDLPGK